MKAIVLAAGRGKRFGSKTKSLPKCLIPLDRKGSHLLGRYLESFRCLDIHDVTIVVGHLHGLIRKECRKHGQGLKIRFVKNKEFRRGSLVSLYCASHALTGDTLIMDADVYFEAKQLKPLLKKSPSSVFLADTRSKSAGEEMMLMSNKGRLWHISKKLVPGLKIVGEATGIFKLSTKDAPLLKKILKNFYTADIKDVEYEDAYCDLLKKTKVGVVTLRGFWSEMDFTGDRAKIASHLASEKPLVKSPNA
jgi:choline kinase